MRFWSDEQIVHCIHGLAIVQAGFCHGDRFSWPPVSKDFGHDFLKVADLEREQLAIPSSRVGVYAYDRLTVQILNRVCHQPVLTESYHCIFRAKYEIWEEAPV